MDLDWDASSWELWDRKPGRAVTPMDYCDAHCHLDYVLQNNNHGLAWIRKKRICFRWEEGYCWYGQEMCDFAHGPEDVTPRVPLTASDVRRFLRRHNACSASSWGGDWGSTPTEGQDEADEGERGGEAGEWPPPPRPDWQSAGRLRHLVTNCCEVEAIPDTMLLLRATEELAPGTLFCTFGCHPHNYRDYSDAYEAQLLDVLAASGPSAVGWGECGLDYFKNEDDLRIPERHEKMLQVFERQARLAVRRGLPLVVHTREADADTLRILRSSVPHDHPVHIHSFQGAGEMLAEIMASMTNVVIGVSGALTFAWPGGSVDTARQVPLDRLVLETDSPYLSWEPLAIPKVASRVAEVRGGGVTADEVLAASNANCVRFYRLPQC